MNRHIKSILPLASILILLVSACDARYLDAVASSGAPETGPPAAAQIETRSTPTPKGDAGGADQGLTLEHIQTPIAPVGPAEPPNDVDPEEFPSVEERDAILDRVNRGGPERPWSDEAAGAGPEPGTQSTMGPVNDSSNAEPEGKPLSVAELLENPIFDTEIRVYGQVSLLGESPCPRFELISGGKMVVVACALVVEDSGTAETAVSVEGIQNSDQVVVTGELEAAESQASVNDFWATKIERAQ